MLSKKNHYKNLTLSPFTYLRPSLNTISISLICVLLPQVLMLLITKSFRSVFLILISITASFLAELIYKKITRKTFYENSLFIFQGLVIGFFVPENYPPVVLFLLVFIILLIVKYYFGGEFNSWINPIAITIIILFLTGNSFFPEYLINASDIQSGTPALMAIQKGNISLISNDAKITSYLNTKILSHAGVELPDGYISMLWDTGSSIPAFRFNLLTIIASLFLVSFNIIGSIIPYIFIAVYGFLVHLFSLKLFGGDFAQGDVLFALLTSGTLFASFFVLDWYGTTPLTVTGKIIYTIFAAIFAFFIVGCGTSPVGIMFTILCVNIISPVIQLCENQLQKGKY